MTTDPLLVVLTAPRQEGDNDDGFRSMREIVRAVGLDERVVRDKMRKLFDADKLEVKKIQRGDMSGRVSTVPGYRLRTDAADVG